MKKYVEEPPPRGEATLDAVPANLARRIGSLVPAAADPHTQAITIWNGSPSTRQGRIEVELNLWDDAEGYELVDAEGEPVPHQWLGDTGTPPIRLDPTRSELPDFQGIMARLDEDRALGTDILELSMRVLRDTLHIEVTLGEGNGLSRADLAESVHDAQSLADDGGCERVALTLHRAVLLHLTALVPAVPAWGYTTLLVRPCPRPKGASRARKGPAELDSAIESTRQRTFPYAIEHSEGKQRTVPETNQAATVNLHTYVGPCAEGALPPSGTAVNVSPETIAVSAFQWTENGEGAVLQLFNESDHAENACVELLLPARSAELVGMGERTDEILWEDEPRGDFTVAAPPKGTVVIGLRWAPAGAS